MAQLILLLAMLVLLWALLIRPQRSRQRQQQQILSSVEPGDEILTVGGLYGIVQEIDEEDDLIVEVAEGVQVRIARRAVGGVVKPDQEEDEAPAELGAGDAEDAPVAEGVDRVNDSKDSVSPEGTESTAALDRR